MLIATCRNSGKMTEFKSAFVDTSPFIYYIEKSNQYFKKMKVWFSESYKADKNLVTSPVTIEEYCVYPLKNHRLEYVHTFRSFIDDMGIFVSRIDFDTAFLAAQLRSKYQDFKAMDALQLATAIQNRCDIFLTNDKQLRQVTEIKVLLVDEL